ncbi:MAG: kinase/pyrophosphorylase [Gammaproteobacteria bacterium]|nr:kinase/pyrophosphorylase [Gammaproteobacteria bacterium]NNF61953.1 kinase/pyrophosphorylase [Gammaproteobacteria bacterium]NNM21167.1 kinase/pyrophosphorylase [Gammaproteobacteria bacterium]
MNRRTVFFVSDQTGITAETLGRSLLTQFDALDFRQVTLPFISTEDKAMEAVRRIKLTAQVEGRRPVVFATFASGELGDLIRQSGALFLDFFDAFIEPLEKEFETRSSHTIGRTHGVSGDESYQRRIDAMNFALSTDDGTGMRSYEEAEVILIGVSRTGKTPTCIYLALHYGVYAANYPLTDEDFEMSGLPKTVQRYRNKLFGLTIDADQLRRIREERRPDSRYASMQQINFELRESMAMFRRNGISYADTTDSSIEEISSTILDTMEIDRADRR